MSMPDEQPQMSADDAKASLGTATRLQDYLMPPSQGQNPNQDPSQTQETAPQEEEKPKLTEDPVAKMKALEGQFKDFQKEVQKTIKDEIGGVKDMIQEVIDQEPNGE